MHAIDLSRWTVAFCAVLAVAGCASTGGADRAPTALEAGAAPSATPPDKATAASATVSAEAMAATRSRLVRPGQDPAIAGPGVDIRAMPPGFAPSPAGLEARVEQRWKLLMAGDGEKAFDFLSAGVRSALDRSTYASDMRSRPVKWLAADAVDAQCEGTSCAARVLMTIKFSMQSTGAGEIQSESAISERWIKVGDDWFHIPDQYLEGFAK